MQGSFCLLLLIIFSYPYVVFSSSHVTAQQLDTIELGVEDLPRLLQERNRNVQAMGQSIQASQQRTGYLARSYLPNVTAEVGGEYFQTGSYSARAEPYGLLETRVNLFRGGRDALEEGIRQSEVKLTSAQAQWLITGELTAARKTYWMLVFQRESVQIIKEALQKNEQNLLAAKRRIQRGLTSNADQVEFEINRDMLQEEIASLEHEIELTQIKLRSFFSWTDDKAIQTSDRVPHRHDEGLLARKIPMNTHPEVVTMQARSEVSIEQGAQASRWWLPSVDLYAGAYLYTLRDRDYINIARRDDYVIGARLTVPLFDGFQSKVQAASLALASDALANQAVQKERAIQSQVKIAQEELKHHHELIHIAENRILMGSKYLAQTLVEYDRGVKNSPDVLGALQRDISFKKRYAEIKRDYQLFKADLLALFNE